MPGGIPVDRHWVLVLQNGTVLIDWGNQLYQDVDTGVFLELEENLMAQSAPEEMLKVLKQRSIIVDWDDRVVYFNYLPERPSKPID
ncbi:MAG: hypothetical protein JEZ00_09850 [Anaerolineaceae bacterium]|nr:hypothetical protein [Anaerolineaceae bacterium]